MAGFDNDVVYANNADFSVAGAGSGSAANGLQLDGQLWTGSTAANVGGTHINVGNITSPNGTLNISYSSPNITVELTGGGGPAIQTLSDDVNASISPSGTGNIQLVGHVNEQGATKFSTIVAGTNLANINPMSSSRWIVDSLGFNGTHTTIASAITSATSGDTIFVLPGTYTENLTLKAGVNITAYLGDEFLPNVTIIGKSTFTAAGTANISNIRLQTNSDFVLAVTGSNASIINLENCYLNCTNNTGISFTVTNTSSAIYLKDCEGDIGTTGITLFSFSGTGLLDIRYSNVTNIGATSTNSTCSAGSLALFWSNINFPITVSSTGTIQAFNSGFGVSTTTPLTLTNSPGHDVFIGCEISGGTNSSISIGAACVTALLHTDINSDNTNALTGAGTLEAPSVTFSGSSFANNVTTIAPFPFGLTGTFTPILTFGGASVGITYASQSGKYWLIGKIVYYSVAITLTNKGTSVGDANILGLPFTSANDGFLQMASTLPFISSFPAGTTTATAYVLPNSTQLNLVATGAAALSFIGNGNFANNSSWDITGFYWCP